MMDFGYGIQMARLREEHLDSLFRWRNDPRIFKYTRQNEPLHWDNHVDWFKWQRNEKSLSMFGAFTSDSNPQLVGVIGLTSIDLINRRAEFSCYINPEEQGKGFGQAALKSLFEYGFKILGLNLIWGETFAGNPAAKQFEKLGMTLHGTRPDFYFREGRFIDAHLYGIRASEWGAS